MKLLDWILERRADGFPGDQLCKRGQTAAAGRVMMKILMCPAISAANFTS
jgi:hypothetical protein